MNRRTALIGGGAALALLIMWFFLLWGPQGGKLDDARARVDVAEAENSQLELRLQRLQAAQEGAPARLAELAELRRAVPNEPELAQFILDANDAASAAGVDFLSISPAPPSLGEAGLPPVIGLSISVSGEYFAVLDYLERIDDLPRIVVIDSLGLTPGAGEGSQQQLSVAITGRMFANGAPQLATTTTTTTTTAPPNG